MEHAHVQSSGTHCALLLSPSSFVLRISSFLLCCAALLTSCTGRDQRVDPGADRPPTTQPSGAGFDTTAPKPRPARDTLERWVYDRWGDLRLVDRMMDGRTEPPPFDRRPLPAHPEDARIAEGVPLLPDTEPFPEPVPLPPKDVTIRVGLARSTFRTRTRAEVLSAVQPFIDLVQREVNIRGEPMLYENAADVYYALLDGTNQMVVAHVFDYLLIRSWFADAEENGTILLAWAQPANPRVVDDSRPGIPGTAIELVVAKDAAYESPADLKGARLALAANYVDAPGAWLTSILHELGHPPDTPFFKSVRLRRYPKDAIIDVLKGKADAACVDQGTVGALAEFYGIENDVRTLAVSPRYNIDVLFTSVNNLETHKTEIELTQRQLTTLGKDPEGQEVLFFFDVERWHNYYEGDIAVAREHFDDFLRFIDHTPADLKPLLDPDAAVDAQTYTRFGDE